VNLFESLFGVVDGVLASYVNGAVANAAAYIAVPLATLGTVAFVLFGLVLLSGRSEIPVAEFVKKGGLLALVLTIGTSAATFNSVLAAHLLALPDELMAVFAGTSGSGAIDDTASVGRVLDGIATQSIDGIAAIWQSGGWTDPGPAFMAVFLFAVFLLFGASAGYAVLVMKIGLALSVALGPLLILGLLFNATREFFTRWLSYVLQFAVLAGLIGGVAGIADAVVATYLAGINSGGQALDLVQLLAPALVLVVLAILFAQLPGMASSITGGIGLGVGNIAARGMQKGAGFAAWHTAGKHMSAWGRASDRHRTDRAERRQEQLRGLGDRLNPLKRQQTVTPSSSGVGQGFRAGGGGGNSVRAGASRPSRTAEEERRRVREREEQNR
jgi:type IV secretion system protein VirB6